MLSDFVMLEAYYGFPDAGRSYEDLIKDYKIEALKRAVQEGYLACKILCLGSGCGKAIYYLTPKGRALAKKTLRNFWPEKRSDEAGAVRM